MMRCQALGYKHLPSNSSGRHYSILNCPSLMIYDFILKTVVISQLSWQNKNLKVLLHRERYKILFKYKFKFSKVNGF